MSDSETFGMLDLETVNEFEGDLNSLLLTAIQEGDDATAAGILRDAGDELRYSPELLDRIAAADLVEAFRAYPWELPAAQVEHVWAITIRHRSWKVLEEMIRQGKTGRRFVGGEPEQISRAVLVPNAASSRDLSRALAARKIGDADWPGAHLVMQNTSIALHDSGLLLEMVLTRAPDWFIEFVLDSFPISDADAVRGARYLGEPQRSRYLEMLKQRGYDLASVFASGDLPGSAVDSLYDADYAETAMLQALEDGDRQVVDLLASKGIRVVRPRLFA